MNAEVDRNSPTKIALTARFVAVCISGWGVALLWRRLLDWIFHCTPSCIEERSHWIGEIGFWTLLPILLGMLHIFFVLPLRRHQMEQRRKRQQRKK
jgi:hypothetical protein